jgi:hypothetical protein
MDCVVSPVLQLLPFVKLDDNVIEPPSQKVVGPLAEIVGEIEDELIVIKVPADVAEHPPELKVTVYVPALVTVID